jgi:hypothetical protein
MPDDLLQKVFLNYPKKQNVMKKILLTCLIFIASAYSSYVLAQNRARFHHIIKKADVESGVLPLVYDDGKVQHKLYGKERDSNFAKICSDLDAIVTLGSSGVANVDIFSFTSGSPAPCINISTPLGTKGNFTLDIIRDSLGDPTYVYKIPFKLKTWSVATVPFRYRFKADSSFSTVTTNLSVSLSYSWSLFGRSILTHRLMSNYYILAGPFLGLTSVTLNKSAVKRPSSWTTDRTNIGMSYGASFTLGRNNFGLVVSIGLDHAFGSQSKEWSYQDKPWLGLGVNTSLGVF